MKWREGEENNEMEGGENIEG
jgi:hypothetical protein